MRSLPTKPATRQGPGIEGAPLVQRITSPVLIDDVFDGIDGPNVSPHLADRRARQHNSGCNTTSRDSPISQLLTGRRGRVPVVIERAEGLLVEHRHTLPELEIYCVSSTISARARERYRMAATKSEASMRSCWPTLWATSTPTPLLSSR